MNPRRALFVLAAVLVAVFTVLLVTSDSSFAARKAEYKVVVLDVQGSSMPSLSAALEAEAERGYELAEMSVIPPGTMYLVFEK